MNQYITTDMIKITISLLSLVIAFWQFLEKRKTKKLIALEAIELHQNIALVLGATQAAKSIIPTGAPGRFEIGRAEGMCNSILLESAKLYCNLKNTKIDDIDDLIANGQLDLNYRPIYISFSDSKRGNLRMFFKRIYRLI